MKSILIGPLLILATVASGQSADDAAIRKEYTELLEFLRPPEGVELNEEGARQRAEVFRNNLASFIQRWIENRGELKTGRLVLGKALSMAGRPQEALPHLKAYFEQHQGHEEYEDGWITLATTALDARDLPLAENLLSRFLAERAGSERLAVVRYYLGLTRAQMSDPDGAVALLDEVARGGGDDPLSADAALKAIEILMDWGKADLARPRLAELLRQEPEAPYLRALDEKLTQIGRLAPEWVDMVSWPVGSATTLAALKGKVVVLTFFADQYEACRDEVTLLGGLASSGEFGDTHFQVLTRYYRPLDRVPASEQDAGLRTLWTELRATLPLGVASSFSNLRAYGVRGIPHTVVIGRDGVITHVKIGGSRNNEQAITALRAAIKRAL